MKNKYIFAASNQGGDVAQLVEQRTENPCVGGSIPSITTSQIKREVNASLFYLLHFDC